MAKNLNDAFVRAVYDGLIDLEHFKLFQDELDILAIEVYDKAQDQLLYQSFEANKIVFGDQYVGSIQ